MSMKARTLLLIMILLSSPLSASSHPGGLDRYGGHYDHKTGEYHCHRRSCFENPQTREGIKPALKARFIEAVDGDTIRVYYRIEHQEVVEKVRLIGVDTPERGQVFYSEAASFTANEASGKTVRLEFDRRLRGRYGRLLAYVYLPDGVMLNTEIIRQGYGCLYTKYPFRYVEQFRKTINGAGHKKRVACKDSN